MKRHAIITGAVAAVYYVEWTVLGFCALKLLESKHGFFWFPPLMIWYVIKDSIEYRRRIDDVYTEPRGGFPPRRGKP